MRRERRVAERYEACLPVEFRCGSIHGKGRLLNASLAGARIEAVTGQPFPGEEIRLFLWLPSSPESVELSAQVVRHTETGGFAVRFHKLDIAALRVLRTALPRVQELSYKRDSD